MIDIKIFLSKKIRYTIENINIIELKNKFKLVKKFAKRPMKDNENIPKKTNSNPLSIFSILYTNLLVKTPKPLKYREEIKQKIKTIKKLIIC